MSLREGHRSLPCQELVRVIILSVMKRLRKRGHGQANRCNKDSREPHWKTLPCSTVDELANPLIPKLQLGSGWSGILGGKH